MAEIEIQRKKRPVWPWILGAIAALLLLWFVIDTMNKKTDDTSADVVPAGTVEDPERQRRMQMSDQYSVYPGPVAAFLIFANQEEPSDMNKSHEYTHNGLMQLGEALRFIADTKGGIDVNQKLNNIREENEKLMRDPGSELHSAIMRNCFIMASEVMSALQQKHFTDVKAKVDNARQAAEEMDSNKPALEQESRVKSFFSKAADAVESMSKEFQQPAPAAQ